MDFDCKGGTDSLRGWFSTCEDKIGNICRYRIVFRRDENTSYDGPAIARSERGQLLSDILRELELLHLDMTDNSQRFGTARIMGLFTRELDRVREEESRSKGLSGETVSLINDWSRDDDMRNYLYAHER